MKTFLFILISFVAVTATLSGLFMLSNPDGAIMRLPQSLLNGTPFRDFQIPGILLTALVGGVNFLAVLYNLQQHRNRYNWAIGGGIMICGWIIVQMILMHSAHWLQFLYLGIGMLIILVAFQLKGKWAA